MPSLISFGKVRASWSKVGNDIPLFVSNTVGHIAAGGIPQPNDTAPFGTLKPEMSSSFEIGTEWKFFDYRMDWILRSIRPIRKINSSLYLLPLEPHTSIIL